VTPLTLSPMTVTQPTASPLTVTPPSQPTMLPTASSGLPETESDDALLSVPAVIGIAASALVCVGLVGFFVVKMRRGSRATSSDLQNNQPITVEDEMAALDDPEYHIENALDQSPGHSPAESPQKSSGSKASPAQSRGRHGWAVSESGRI